MIDQPAPRSEESLRHEYSEVCQFFRHVTNLRSFVVSVFFAVMGGVGFVAFGKGQFDGLVHGKLDPTHGGWIDLEQLGRSDLAWAVVATSPDKIRIELPSSWQGEENVLFRSTVTRQ